jgi:hypothetical protein
MIARPGGTHGWLLSMFHIPNHFAPHAGKAVMASDVARRMTGSSVNHMQSEAWLRELTSRTVRRKGTQTRMAKVAVKVSNTFKGCGVQA